MLTPAKTRKAEKEIRAQLAPQLPKGFIPLQGALRIEVRIFKTKPKSTPKKVKYPAKAPDLDNYLKLYLDAMNKLVFNDDAQICRIETSKEFCNGASAGAIITIKEMEGDNGQGK